MGRGGRRRINIIINNKKPLLSLLNFSFGFIFFGPILLMMFNNVGTTRTLIMVKAEQVTRRSFSLSSSSSPPSLLVSRNFGETATIRTEKSFSSFSSTRSLSCLVADTSSYNSPRLLSFITPPTVNKNHHHCPNHGRFQNFISSYSTTTTTTTATSSTSSRISLMKRLSTRNLLSSHNSPSTHMIDIKTTTRLFSSSDSSQSPSTSNNENKQSSSSVSLPFTKLPYSGAEIRLDGRMEGNNSDNTHHQDDIRSYSDEEFLQRLDDCLKYLIDHDYMSCWIHVPISRASLIEHLCSSSNSDKKDDSNQDSSITTTTTTTTPPKSGFGFDLHHTNSTTQCIVLKKWIRQDGVEDKIPPYATHQVGCAGFVLNKYNELLLVKEWSGPPSNRIPSTQWKLPGGLCDVGESFQDAVCREVWEETGIECDFESILSFWHRHGLTFGKSDLYYVCLLKPKEDDDEEDNGKATNTITRSRSIKYDPIEISDACWMSIDEFVSTQDHPLILHILKHVFHIEKDTHNHDNEDTTTKGPSFTERLVPISEMMEGPVQFGNRSPFPTYTPRKRK